MFAKSFLFSVVALAACATTHAATAAFDNYTVNAVYGLADGSSVGQSFVVGGLTPFTLMDVSFPQIAGTTGHLSDGYTAGETFSIYTDNALSGDVPGTVLPYTFTLTHTQYTLATSATPVQGSSQGLTMAAATVPIVLTPGRYWLELNAPTGGVINWNFADYDISNPSYYKSNSTGVISLPATNTSYDTDSSGTAFSNLTDGPQLLIINVPEPSTYCLMAVAGLALVVGRKRSRKLA